MLCNLQGIFLMRHEFYKAKTSCLFSGFIFIVSLFFLVFDNVMSPDTSVISNIIFAIFFLFSLNALLSIKTFKLIIDDDGVYVYSGYLPWAKGAYGFSWHEVGKASYRVGFIAWATGSYNIEIDHKFKDKKINLTSIKNGNKAVEMINEIIRERENPMRISNAE